MKKTIFLSRYWKYYLSLEADFLTLTKYIELDKVNYPVYSTELLKLLLSICAEVEVIFRDICGFKAEERCFMKDYQTEVIGKKLMRKSNILTVYDDSEITTITPFENFIENSSSLPPSWWTAYNKVKHGRSSNYSQANLKHVFLALGGLYLLEQYLFCIIEPNGIEELPSKSKLFSVSWE